MIRTCRVCGCTDKRACLVLGISCCWIEEDLCSACGTAAQLIASEDVGLPWLIDVMVEHACRQLLPQLEVPVLWKDGA